MKEDLRKRYNLEHFEVIEVDTARKVYSPVLLRASASRVLEDA